MGVGVPLLLVVGGLLSVQAAANVQLARAVRSPVGAAAVQLAVASLLLLVATVAVGATGVFGLLPDVPVWHLLGGFGSAVYITAWILLFPRLARWSRWVCSSPVRRSRRCCSTGSVCSVCRR